MENKSSTEIEEIKNMVIENFEPKTFEVCGVMHLLIPEDFKMINFKSLDKTPTRIAANIDIEDMESFIKYWHRHASKQNSILFSSNLNKTSFTAIFDYHQKEIAGWCDHTAEYNCPFSKEWKLWKDSDKYRFDQVEFAEFIESNLIDIIGPDEKNNIPDSAPSGATMLEVATNLQAKTDISFSSAIRLSNGQTQLRYTEVVDGTTRNGELKTPTRFFIGIPVFHNGENYKIECLFRYRINEKKLTLWYELLRPHKAIDHAYKILKEEIQEKCDTVIYSGSSS